MIFCESLECKNRSKWWNFACCLYTRYFVCVPTHRTWIFVSFLFFCYSVVLFLLLFIFVTFFPCWLFFVLEIIAALSKITKIETHNNTRQIRTDCPLLLLRWNKLAFINKYGLRRECQTKKKCTMFSLRALSCCC